MKGTVEARGAYQSSWKNSGQRDEKKRTVITQKIMEQIFPEGKIDTGKRLSKIKKYKKIITHYTI